jgi:excisionase family DNA binding protein
MTEDTKAAGPKLFTIPETAKRLGYKTTAPVYRMISRGELPVVKIPAGSRIDAADLEKYIEKNKRVA